KSSRDCAKLCRAGRAVVAANRGGFFRIEARIVSRSLGKYNGWSGQGRTLVITCFAYTASPRPTAPTRSKCRTRRNPQWSWHGGPHRQPCVIPTEQRCLAIPTGAVSFRQLLSLSVQRIAGNLAELPGPMGRR